jgi:LysR family positive regulator for ilvC
MQKRGLMTMDLRDLKTFLHLAESRHFGRSARAMHVSPSTLSRQIQRLEDDLGQPLFLRDNRTVTLTEAGEQLRQFAQHTLLQYQQMRHTLGQQGPSLSGELHLFCSVTAAYSHLPPILDRFRAEHPSVEIKLTTGDAADAVEKVDSNEADLAIAGKPESLPPGVAFSMLENLSVALIAPALPCPVRAQVSQPEPDWAKIPFIMPEQGPVRRRIELWFRRQKISNPVIYATVAGHEAMVSMVALGCGVALIPEIVLENSPEPVRNRVLILERNDEKTPFELGVCVQKKRLNEPLISAFWKLLPGSH